MPQKMYFTNRMHLKHEGAFARNRRVNLGCSAAGYICSCLALQPLELQKTHWKQIKMRVMLNDYDRLQFIE